MLLQDKTVVITGAAGALGQAALRIVVAQGGTAILFDRAFGDEEGGDWPQYEIDLTDRAAVLACVAKVGPFDAVLNIAGGFAMGTPVHAADDPDWAKMMALNVETCRNMIAATVPVLKKKGGGAIVNVGAYAARQGAVEMGAYIASKAVVMRLTETLAEEVRGEGIRVNAVLPTILDTAANRDAMPDADPDQWVKPDRLAAVMAFLASDMAKDVHGALVPVRALS